MVVNEKVMWLAELISSAGCCVADFFRTDLSFYSIWCSDSGSCRQWQAILTADQLKGKDPFFYFLFFFLIYIYIFFPFCLMYGIISFFIPVWLFLYRRGGCYDWHRTKPSFYKNLDTFNVPPHD